MVKRFLGTAIFGYFALFMVLTLLIGLRWNKERKAPEQPIAFSHEIHAGTLNLECLFCHESADKSYFAGVPTVQKCMECHRNVKTDTPEVQKLAKYWEDEEPVPWNRVHRIRVREFVYFTHKRHIKKDIQCEQCHGDLTAMAQVRAVSSLKMGWCVSCHLENEASVDCQICHK